jgi:hypothetical protein
MNLTTRGRVEMIDRISNGSLNPLNSSDRIHKPGEALENATNAPKQPGLHASADGADISADALEKLAQEAELKPYLTALAATAETGLSDRVQALKALLNSPEGVASYLDSIDTQDLADRILNKGLVPLSQES